MSRLSYPPLKSLSQNFLTSETQARKLVEQISLKPGDRVVEFGAGKGAITFLLAEKAFRVLAVEIDAGHARELREKVEQSGKKQIEVLHADLLKTDWKKWRVLIGEPLVIVGNLPYHISTPILFKIIENRSFIKAAHVMLQKEVSDRLLAQPGTKTYGVITVLIGYYARIRSLMQLKPGAFFPRPKVSSTFIEMTFIERPDPAIIDEEIFRWLVRQAFAQRRKQIKNALTADGRFSGEVISGALKENKLDPQCRGETLTIDQFTALSNTLAGKAKY
jgi:16S rRNA (adenine1518-N6/adenine1519-N6)-dimethyltransferase